MSEKVMANPDLLQLFSSFDTEHISSNDIEWLRRCDKSTHFLHWFEHYINTDCTLSPEEIDEYNCIDKNGLDLRGAELDSALAEYGVVIDDTSPDVTNVDFNCLVLDIKNLILQKETLQELNTLHSKVVESCTEKEIKLEQELTKFRMGALSEGQSLMKLSAMDKSVLASLNNTVLKLISTSVDKGNKEIPSKSLDLFLLQCEKFDSELQHFIKQQFKEPKPSDDKNLSRSIYQKGLISFDHGFGDIPDKMWTASTSKISLTCQYHGIITADRHLNDLMENLHTRSWHSLQIEAECVALEEENVRLSEEIDRLQKHQVADVVKKEVMCNITQVALRVAQERVHRRGQMLKKLQKIQDHLNKWQLVVDFVWMLLCREEKSAGFASTFLTELDLHLKEECNTHWSNVESLEIIDKQYRLWKSCPPSIQFPLFESLKHILRPKDNETGSISITDILNQNEHEIASLVSEIVKIIPTYLHRQSELVRTLHDLCNAVSSGPTRKFNLARLDYLHLLNKVKSSLSCSREEIDSLVKLFATKQIMLQSPLVRNQRLLWVWFLLNPSRLQEVLHQAEIEAQMK